MELILKILLVLIIITLLFGVSLGISWLAYKLVLVSGAPKYIAVIVGIAVFLFGVKINFNGK